MLAAAPGMGYIHEPFNINIEMSVNPNPFQRWFEYVCEDNAAYYEQALTGIFRYQYPLRCNIKKVRTARHLGKIAKDQALFLLYRLNKARPLVKDPFAVFSLEWLNRTYDANVLVMIRHPLAFVSSLKIKGWHFDFGHFLAQPYLMSDHLAKFEGEVREYTESNRSVVEQASLLWNCIYYTVNTYRERHPDWMFVKHEHLSTDPLDQFRSIFNAFDLDFTDRVKRRILTSTGAHNPAEAETGNEFRRNSIENLDNWRRRLSADEIDLIKDRTSEVARLFYCEDDW